MGVEEFSGTYVKSEIHAVSSIQAIIPCRRSRIVCRHLLRASEILTLNIYEVDCDAMSRNLLTSSNISQTQSIN